MKIVVKKPGADAEIREEASIQAINKIVGNVDLNGNGYDYASSDIRMTIAPGIDMYVNENAARNYDQGENLWAPSNNVMFFGNVAFAGYDPDARDNNGASSLTDEQIQTVLQFIQRQKPLQYVKRHKKD